MAILAVCVRGVPPDVVVRRAAMEQVLERFKSEEPVLEPNRQYRLLVTTQVVEVGRRSLEGAEIEAEGDLGASVAIAGSTCSFEQTFPFRTQGPPGAAALSELQPGVSASHLDTLETYVREVVPPRGAAAFYRNYDLGVAFNADYIEQMCRANGQNLAIALRSDGGQIVSVANAMGKGRIALRREERTWIELLNRSSCALSLDESLIVKETALRTMPRDPLEPRRRYDATLTGDPQGSREAQRPLFQWSFTSSAYRNFTEHFRLASRPRRAALAGIAGPVWGELARSAIEAGDAWSVGDAERELPRKLEREAFAAMLDWLGVENALPQAVELYSLEADGATWALLIASPEPFDWARLTLALTAQTERLFGPSLRLIRDGDGARVIILALDDGVPMRFPEGDYSLTATYRRNAGPGLPELTERGAGKDEIATISWSIPVEPELGVYPTGISTWHQLSEAKLRGTEILILKERRGPLQLHIESYPWGLTGGDIHATDAWVLSPTGQELWHGELIDRVLQSPDLPPRTRPSGDLAKRLEVTVPTDETGLFRVLFGSHIFPLYQRLTDDLPEALLLKPTDVKYHAGSARSILLTAAGDVREVIIRVAVHSCETPRWGFMPRRGAARAAPL